jgi:hypothetical protein
LLRLRRGRLLLLAFEPLFDVVSSHRWKGGGGWMTPVEYAAAATKIAAE